MRQVIFLIAVSISVNSWATTGEQTFGVRCAGCHQLDGSGDEPWIPTLQSLVTAKDTQFLINAMLSGQFRRGGELNGHTIPTMPSWARLSNEEIAQLVNYINARFGSGDRDVTATDVAALRHAD